MNIKPDINFSKDIEEIIDRSNIEYLLFLEDNDDVDNIEELSDILNSNNIEELSIEFIVNDKPRDDKNEWISAMADWSLVDGKTITVILHSKNLETTWGPESFKEILMKMLAHETIHFNQYDKISPLVIENLRSGHQKGLILKENGGTERDWMRSYLRDPHEIMAYGHDLSVEIKESSNPSVALRNPEMFIDELPVYARYRDIFPKGANQIKQLLKYTASYYEY
jgi:hypothetical protein